MKLLTEKELIWSVVVANNRMNRERKASGVNSYEREIHFNPVQFLRTCIDRTGQGKWLDLCCGKGNALLQCAADLSGYGLQDKAILKGVDLIDEFQHIPSSITCLQWEASSVVDWIPDDRYDLITCIHGLHYVGDKLRVLEMACGALTERGRLLVNIDLGSIKGVGTYVKDVLVKHGITYDVRKKLLICEGQRTIKFGLTFKGASDQAGPNYTGQEAVDAYYFNSFQRT